MWFDKLNTNGVEPSRTVRPEPVEGPTKQVKNEVGSHHPASPSYGGWAMRQRAQPPFDLCIPIIDTSQRTVLRFHQYLSGEVVMEGKAHVEIIYCVG